MIGSHLGVFLKFVQSPAWSTPPARSVRRTCWVHRRGWWRRTPDHRGTTVVRGAHNQRALRGTQVWVWEDGFDDEAARRPSRVLAAGRVPAPRPLPRWSGLDPRTRPPFDSIEAVRKGRRSPQLRWHQTCGRGIEHTPRSLPRMLWTSHRFGWTPDRIPPPEHRLVHAFLA